MGFGLRTAADHPGSRCAAAGRIHRADRHSGLSPLSAQQARSNFNASPSPEPPGLSAQEESEGASPGDAPQSPAPSPAAAAGPPPIWRSWGWAFLIAGLAVLGVLLAIADTALYGPSLGPYATFLIGPTQVISIPLKSPSPERFIRTRLPERVPFAAPFGTHVTFSPWQALRAFLSNGAGLVLLALGMLLLFPNRARIAVQRLERRHAAEGPLAAGIATIQ